MVALRMHRLRPLTILPHMPRPTVGRAVSLTRHALSFALVAAVAAPLAAQQAGNAPRPQSVTDTSIFAPLTLPTANEMRAGSGAPGSRYWQNRADYKLAATLDTTAKTVRGEMTLRYTNNSPDTLRYIWLQ